MSYSFHKNNGIPIKSWYEDKSDRDLIKMIPYLQNLSFFYDVRSEIPRFVVNNTIIWKKAFEWLEEYNLLNPKMIEVIPIKLYSGIYTFISILTLNLKIYHRPRLFKE